MNLLMLIAWLALIVFITSIPVFMYIKNNPMTTRDLFFVLVGMAIIGLHQLESLLQ